MFFNLVAIDKRWRKVRRPVGRPDLISTTAMPTVTTKTEVFDPFGDMGDFNLPPDYISKGLREVNEDEIKYSKSLIESYRKDPLKFVRKELGIPTHVWRNDCPPSDYISSPLIPLPLWSKQREILKALVEHRKVAVKSAHTQGKTHVAAIATLYLTYVWQALGITTAPSGRQVKRLLWAEINAIWNRANQWQRSRGRPGLGGKLLQTSLELGDKWYVIGFSTDSKEFNIPGFHEETVFVIVDEACGCAPELFPLLDTILSSKNSIVLYIGNPIDPDTEFKRAFDPDSDFYQITISAYDSPNVRNKKIIYPKLCHPEWPDRIKAKYGEEDSYFISRVLGEFPQNTVDSLIPFRYIQAALDRELPEGRTITLGADIARMGGDRIIVRKRSASGRSREVLNNDKQRVTQTAGQIANTLRQEAVKDEEGNEIYPTVNVDDIGVGGGVTDILLEQEENFPVNGINVGESAKEKQEMEPLDELARLKFQNKRAYYYWKLRNIYMAGEVDIDDAELARELMAIRKKEKSDGTIAIVEKDAIKKDLGGRSPDKAEAHMLEFAEDEVEGISGTVGGGIPMATMI
jgi:hypothetical protein